MADTLNFGEAVQRAGVSRQRLNEAIRSGRLPAVRGGGPGKPTTIQLDDLQAWCLREGLAVPLDTGERLEHLSASTGIAETMARLDQMFAGMQRLEQLMGQVLERLERSQGEAVIESRPAPLPQPQAPTPPWDAVMARIRHAREVEEKSYQQIADELNAAGIPTATGQGQWHRASVRHFYTPI
jgi:hypothetical protein